MSSSVVLNGGSFAIGPAVEGQDHARRHHRASNGVGYDEDAWQPEDLVATVHFLASLDDRLPYVLPVSGSDVDFCRDEVRRRGPDAAEPVFVVDADDVSRADNDAMPEEAPLVDAAAAAAAADENSASSAAQTPCSTEERSIIRATNKPAHLKRVSFGSTKGSMVETLIYEKPAADDEQPATNWRTKNRNFVRSIVSAVPANHDAVPEEAVSLLSGETTRSASKVRVTYFESKRPLTLPSPEASDAEWDDTMAEPPPQQHQQAGYNRQTSTESGQDNPFRPDGDLSREADELVELLKGGRPISEVLKSQEDGQRHLQEQHDERRESDAEPPEATESTPLAGAATPSPVKAGAATPSDARAASPRANNGSVGETAEKGAADEGVVEVQRVAAPAPVESQAEHVVIKKKSNCNCCVLQ